MGATASGKTQLAVETALSIGGEIISADSRQFYKFMDIGTAKPPLKDRDSIPHHLIDVVLPGEEFTLSQYQELAYEVIEKIFSSGKVPILVGGTGLYIRAVTQGYTLPRVPPKVEFRKLKYMEAKKYGISALYNELLSIDPEASYKIHPLDLIRIIRALEVYYFSGKKISSFWGQKNVLPWRIIKIGLSLPRNLLYQRINTRVEEMMSLGFLEEVKVLVERGFKDALFRMRPLGYIELLEHLAGKLTLEEAVELIKRNTRRFAKRQLTWFRKEKDVVWIEMDKMSQKEALQKIISLWKDN